MGGEWLADLGLDISTSRRILVVSTTRPRTQPLTRPTPPPAQPIGSAPISDRIVRAAATWAQSQQRLVTLAAELADSGEWIASGAPTAAHHLAALADIEPCTAREWLRVGTRVRALPITAERFASGALSYSKVRALVSVATPENEAELVSIAEESSAADLRLALAKWLNDTSDPDDLARYHHDRRSVSWRTDADGMVTFTLRLPPAIAAVLITMLTTMVMRSRARPNSEEAWPTVAQQHADAFERVLNDGTGRVLTEVVLHVRGDGCTADDGTPIAETAIARLVPDAFVRALIHDAEGRPVDASSRRRHPTARQKRVVKERDRACVDCGRHALLEYDHVPSFERSGRTVVDELQLRCAPCHQRRHGERT